MSNRSPYICPLLLPMAVNPVVEFGRLYERSSERV